MRWCTLQEVNFIACKRVGRTKSDRPISLRILALAAMKLKLVTKKQNGALVLGTEDSNNPGDRMSSPKCVRVPCPPRPIWCNKKHGRLSILKMQIRKGESGQDVDLD